MDGRYEAATQFLRAADCYKEIDIAQGIHCSFEAMSLFISIGRFYMVAKPTKDVGELCERRQKFELASFYYERAASIFQVGEATTSVNQCKMKVAQLSAQLEQYPKAIEIFEEIARHSLNNNLLKCDVRGFLLNAGICQLCIGDPIAITNALDKYQDLDPTFSRTSEYRLLVDLVAAIDEEDVSKLMATLKKYDRKSSPDAWRTTLLSRVKEALKAKKMEDDNLK